MLIRALDYMPPVDISFGDFLSAVITADSEACPDDDKYRYRDILLESFAAYGIEPSSSSRKIPGAWGIPAGDFVYGHAHFAEMRWDREAIFRFIWENQEQLGLVPNALTTVESVRPVVRNGADGFVLHEVVAEYFQLITLRGDELADIGLRAPKGMPGWQSVRLYGGSTLIFDEFGHLKFDIGNRLNSRRQSERLQELWDRGAFRAQFESERRFARLHRERAMGQSTLAEEPRSSGSHAREQAAQERRNPQLSGGVRRLFPAVAQVRRLRPAHLDRFRIDGVAGGRGAGAHAERRQANRCRLQEQPGYRHRHAPA
jgi:hypothetical protein